MDRSDPLIGRALLPHLGAFVGCAVLFGFGNGAFAVLAVVLDGLHRELLAVLCVAVYAPFATVVSAALVGWLGGFRLAPALAMLTLYPARAMAVLLWERDPWIALLAPGPTSVLEWVLGTLALLIAASPLAAIDRERTQPVALGVAFVGAGAATAVLGTALYLALRMNLVERLHRVLGSGVDDEVLALLVLLLAYGALFFALTALATPRSALVPAWLGAVLGAAVVGLVHVGLTTPARPLLYLQAGMPMVAVGALALPPCLAGSAIRWLWRLSVEPAEA